MSTFVETPWCLLNWNYCKYVLQLKSVQILAKHCLFSGSEVFSLTGPPVTLDQWQEITMSRSGQEVNLRVADQSVEGTTPGSSSGLDLQTPLWVGWVPGDVALHSNVEFLAGFEGCVHSIKVSFGKFCKMFAYINRLQHSLKCLKLQSEWTT